MPRVRNSVNFVYLLRDNARTESTVQTELGSFIMDMKDETVTHVLCQAYIREWNYNGAAALPSQNEHPTPNCNEGVDCICRQLTTCDLTPKRIRRNDHVTQ